MAQRNEVIRDLAKQKINQETIAAMLDVSQSTVSNVLKKIIVIFLKIIQKEGVILGDRVDVSTFANSQCAIREYMHFKLENEYMHEARVLVSSMGKLGIMIF